MTPKRNIAVLLLRLPMIMNATKAAKTNGRRSILASLSEWEAVYKRVIFSNPIKLICLGQAVVLEVVKEKDDTEVSPDSF